MPTIRKQYFGLKFPFTNNNLNGFFLDLNLDLKSKIESEIAHVILTPKGSRLRRPEFGTGLAKYIFDQNDNITWEDVRKEAIEAVRKYVKDTELEDIEVMQDNENDHALYLDLHYKVKKGMTYENNRTVIKL
jgi:hypothetical protein